MRAYRGKIEATSPLAKMAEKETPPPPPAAPAPKPQPAPERKTLPRAMVQPVADGPSAVGSNTSNLIMISAIVVLVLAAIGLLVALVIR
jgi:hypothetical protein